MQTGMIRLGIFCIRRVFSIMTCWKQCCRGDTMKVTRSLRLPPYKLDEGVSIPSPFIVETWNNGDSLKTWIQYSGETIVGHYDPFEIRARAPWAWFGYRLPSGDMIDLTGELSEFVLPGNVVKPELIHSYYPKSRFGTLVYVDSETFVVNELSSMGLTIADAPEPRDIRFGRGVCPASDCAGTGKLD